MSPRRPRLVRVTPDLGEEPHQDVKSAGDFSVVTGRVPPGNAVDADGRGVARGRTMDPAYTFRQGQFLAFIY